MKNKKINDLTGKKLYLCEWLELWNFDTEKCIMKRKVSVSLSAVNVKNYNKKKPCGERVFIRKKNQYFIRGQSKVIV